MLPKGDLTHDQLSQLLLVYIGTAADIVEFFDAFKEDTVSTHCFCFIVSFVIIIIIIIILQYIIKLVSSLLFWRFLRLQNAWNHVPVTRGWGHADTPLKYPTKHHFSCYHFSAPPFAKYSLPHQKSSQMRMAVRACGTAR